MDLNEAIAELLSNGHTKWPDKHFTVRIDYRPYHGSHRDEDRCFGCGDLKCARSCPRFMQYDGLW